jgi:hypothetical protein
VTTDWRGPVNQLLYGLTFTREITDEVVDLHADAAVRYKTLGLGPETYYRAIGDALASGADLSDSALPQFGDDAVKEFLRAVAARLDALRPWPKPKFLRLNPGAYAGLRQPLPVGKLDSSLLELRNDLRLRFDRVGDTEPRQYAAVLELVTGEKVGLLGSHSPRDKVTLLAESVDDRALTMQHFIAATGYPPDKIVPL